MRKIRQAVILAAGTGSRIRQGGLDLPKPLHRVAGVTLVKRTLMTLAESGVREVAIVVGYRADEIRRAVTTDRDFARAGLDIQFVDNEHYLKSNGVSVLAVKDVLDGPFLLSMCDHVYDPALPRLAAAADMSAADLYLCVDRHVSEVYDIDDATKVSTVGDRIAAIGKQLTTYDCIDTGVFAVGPALLRSLDALYETRGDCSLSDGVRGLAEAGRAAVLDIGRAFWQDVDTVPAQRRAESILAPRERVVARASAV